MDIILAKNEVMRMEGDLRGVAVQCREGTIWITQCGDPRDYFLKAGEKFVINQPGLVVLEAYRAANICFAEPRGEHRVCMLATTGAVR